MAAMGQTVWTPTPVPELGPPRLQFRSTDGIIFKVHDNLLFPQSIALQVLLGDMTINDPSAAILPLNVHSDSLKLILHFVYNQEVPTGGWAWTGAQGNGVSLQTVHGAVLACEQYMMHTIAASLEGPLRANIKDDPLLGCVIAHLLPTNRALCDDALRLASNSPMTFLGSQAPRRSLLPATALDLLYQYREELQIAMKRQETAQSARILASFKVDDLAWNEYDSVPNEDYMPHYQTCRHWPVVANTLRNKLNELLLDLLREKAGLKKLMEVEMDIGCSIRTSCRGCRELLTQNLQRLASELAMVGR